MAYVIKKSKEKKDVKTCENKDLLMNSEQSFLGFSDQGTYKINFPVNAREQTYTIWEETSIAGKCPVFWVVGEVYNYNENLSGQYFPHTNYYMDKEENGGLLGTGIDFEAWMENTGGKWYLKIRYYAAVTTFDSSFTFNGEYWIAATVFSL